MRRVADEVRDGQEGDGQALPTGTCEKLSESRTTSSPDASETQLHTIPRGRNTYNL